MSYLNPPRLHFAGRFRADVSTVNNIVTHFKDPNTPPDPGFNPSGSGSWGLANCTVTSAIRADGSVARTSADDPVIGLSMAQNGKARIVDLDPEQQLVSQIWGLQLQLGKSGGSPAIAGAFKLTAFSDIWFNRAHVAGAGDFKACAFFQSVLADVTWGDLLGSAILNALKAASTTGLLSIKFNVDGFNTAQRMGRIVGTIGPALAGEPEHFVVGRQCMGAQSGPVWYFPAVVDNARGKLVADFGNALQTTKAGGPFDATPNLQMGLLTNNATQFTSLGKLPIGPDGWYEQTAGVCEFPASGQLSAAQLTQLAASPIGVAQQTATGLSLAAQEGLDGLHVRADDFVYRMSAGDIANVTLHASRFGQPLSAATIALAFDDSQLQGGGGDPDVGVPPSGLSFPASVTTDAKGIATAQLTAHAIGTPRDYVDGQVYGARYTLPQSDTNAGGYFDPADFVSVLVWTDYQAPAAPTWWQDVQPILKEYSQLYPVMKGIVMLDDYDSVVANKDRLKMVFSLPDSDPRYMPVTRDLSPAKRQMILNWLVTTGNAGQPNLGTPPAGAVPAAATGKVAAAQRMGGSRSHFVPRTLA